MLEAGMLPAFGLFLVRTSAFVLALPMFGAQTLIGGVKVGLIMSLALILYSVHGTPIPQAASPVIFAMLAMREVLVGLALGFTFQAVMLAVRVGGEMIGSEMAFNMASVVDPATGLNTPLIAQIYELMFSIGLLAIDGHHLVLRALANSFEQAAVGTVEFDGGIAEIAATMVSELFKAGVTFAAPVLVLLLLSSVLIGVIARVMPHANVTEIGFSLRILVGLGAMVLFAPLIAPALQRLYERLDSEFMTMLAALGS